MTEPLRVERASVVYDGARSAALEDADLAIEPGEAVALVGPSGSGKTTLLRLLGAALPPTSGRARIAGEDVAALEPKRLRTLRSRIGMVHQDFALVPSLRVVTNVLSGRLGRGSTLGGLRRVFLPTTAEVAEVLDVLDRVGIGDKLYQRTDTLSGGQQQRVAIARALHQEPSILLADEPISSVDPARALDTLSLLVGLSKERGLTLVVSLHDVTLARRLFPRLVGIRRRRIVFDHDADSVDDSMLESLFDLEAEEMLVDAGT